MKAEHPFIVQLNYSFQDERYAYLVMDYLSGGTYISALRTSSSSDVHRNTQKAPEKSWPLATRGR
mgnify:FL=1